MDLKCTVCLEPWDLFYVNEDFTEEERRDFLAGKGCPVCHGKAELNEEQRDNAEKISVLYDLLGDDLDGVAAEIEDWGL